MKFELQKNYFFLVYLFPNYILSVTCFTFISKNNYFYRVIDNPKSHTNWQMVFKIETSKDDVLQYIFFYLQNFFNQF